MNTKAVNFRRKGVNFRPPLTADTSPSLAVSGKGPLVPQGKGLRPANSTTPSQPAQREFRLPQLSADPRQWVKSTWNDWSTIRRTRQASCQNPFPSRLAPSSCRQRGAALVKPPRWVGHDPCGRGLRIRRSVFIQRSTATAAYPARTHAGRLAIGPNGETAGTNDPGTRRGNP